MAKLITNPAFDKRILRLAQIHGSGTTKFQRGFLITAQRKNPSAATRAQRRYRVNFLYNPSDLSVSHSVNLNDNATALPTELRSDADIGQVRGLTGASMSFSLLFDRTYEVANRDIWNRPEAAMGCYADITALYGMCGITEPTTASTSLQTVYTAPSTTTTNGVAAPASAGDQVYGVMKLNPVFAVFCPVRTVDSAGLRSGISMMRYYGYISSLGVQYTHWTQRMIPARCVASIGMQLLMTDKTLVEP